jgi:hypothetical protein
MSEDKEKKVQTKPKNPLGDPLKVTYSMDFLPARLRKNMKKDEKNE